MNVKSCEKLEKSRVELTVEVDAGEFEAAVQKAYLRERGKIRVPGFRPGKAPRKMMESMFGANVFYDEAINIAMPEAYEAAVKEQKLEPIGQPQAELVSVGKEGLVFKVTTAVYPEATLGQYKGLEAPKGRVVVLDEDIDNRLEQMANRNGRMITVEDRGVEQGDSANIDFEGFLEGVPFDGGKGENFDLEIGSGSFVPGFEEQVVGMRVGEEKDLDITFPENYREGLAGKAVVFHVKVNGIKHKELPEIDDEFAKDVSEFDTLEELKESIRKEITEERQEAMDRAFEDALMEKVAENLTVEVPDVLVEDQAEQFVRRMRSQIQSQGLSFEQYLKMANTTEETVRQESMEPALRQVKVDLAIEAIVKAENLEVSDEEVAAEYEKLSGRYGMDVESLKKYMREPVIREQVLRSKAVAVVADSATATEPEEKSEESVEEPEEKAEE